jgi:hypothetical protein
MDKTRGCAGEDVQEADFVDCVFELVCQPLFATWGVELRKVEGDEVSPVDFCEYLSAPARTLAHHRILTLCLGLFRLSIHR